MRFSRPSRFVAALVTLFSLLFTQLAVAAYACPSLKTAPAAMSATAADAGMPGCQGMDKEQPGLCKAQCEVGHQSLDTPGSPHVQPFIAAGLAVVLPEGAAQQPVIVRSDAYRLTRSTAPPLAIRNCCFRI